MTTCRPWEDFAPLTGGGISDLYPRTISIHRSKNNSVDSGGNQQKGLVTYSGREATTNPSDPAGETVLFTNIPCQIVMKRSGRTTGTTLVGDAVTDPIWDINIPYASLPLYSVRDRDFIYDDEGYRYMVVLNGWTTAGYQLETIRLET